MDPPYVIPGDLAAVRQWADSSRRTTRFPTGQPVPSSPVEPGGTPRTEHEPTRPTGFRPDWLADSQEETQYPRHRVFILSALVPWWLEKSILRFQRFAERPLSTFGRVGLLVALRSATGRGAVRSDNSNCKIGQTGQSSQVGPDGHP
jgi:hypothetical protein